MGKANGLYLLSGVTDESVIEDAIIELLGDVDYDVGDGSLSRTLPREHPFLPWFVAGISSFRGVGGSFQQVVNPIDPLTPEFTLWCLYNQYHIQVDFQPRPYRICDDIFISATVADWVKDDGTTQTFTYYNEWERFTDIDISPSSDSVTVQVGQMAFNATGLPNDANPFLAMPKMYLNNEVLKLTWYMVPMRFYTSDNSYLRRFRGRVNQLTWSTASFGTYSPGELLYLGCNIKRYTPPLANAETVFGQGLTDFVKYCNIEMTFLYTKRTRGADPLNPPSNGNYVAQGHNLNPFFGNGNNALSQTFLYTSTVPSNASMSAPLWRSFPLQLLWTDPDAPGHI